MAEWETVQKPTIKPNKKPVEREKIGLLDQVAIGNMKKRLLNISTPEQQISDYILHQGDDNMDIVPKQHHDILAMVTASPPDPKPKRSRTPPSKSERSVSEILASLTPQQKRMLLLWPPSFGFHACLSRFLLRAVEENNMAVLYGVDVPPCLNPIVKDEDFRIRWFSTARTRFRPNDESKKEIIALCKIVGRHKAADHYATKRGTLLAWLNGKSTKQNAEDEGHEFDLDGHQKDLEHGYENQDEHKDIHENMDTDFSAVSFDSTAIDDQLDETSRNLIVEAFNHPPAAFRYIPPHTKVVEAEDKNAEIYDSSSVPTESSVPSESFTANPIQVEFPVKSAPRPMTSHSMMDELTSSELWSPPPPPPKRKRHTNVPKRNAYTYEQKLEAVNLARKIGRNKAAAHFGLNAAMVGKWMRALENIAHALDSSGDKVGDDQDATATEGTCGNIEGVTKPLSNTAASESSTSSKLEITLPVDASILRKYRQHPQKIISASKTPLSHQKASSSLDDSTSLAENGALPHIISPQLPNPSRLHAPTEGSDMNHVASIYLEEEETQLANYIRIWRAGGFVVNSNAIRRWMMELIRKRRVRHGGDFSTTGTAEGMQAILGGEFNKEEAPPPLPPLQAKEPLRMDDLAAGSEEWLHDFLNRYGIRVGVDTFGPIRLFNDATAEAGQTELHMPDEDVIEESKLAEWNPRGVQVTCDSGDSGNGHMYGRNMKDKKKSMAELWARTVAKLNATGAVPLSPLVGGGDIGGATMAPCFAYVNSNLYDQPLSLVQTPPWMSMVD
jgi:transposase-like protein